MVILELVKAGGNRITFAGSSLELVTVDLNIDTSTFDVSTDNGGKIVYGATPPTSIDSGTGIFMSGSGEFLAGNASGNHIKFDGTNVQVAGQITISAGSTSEVDFGAGAGCFGECCSVYCRWCDFYCKWLRLLRQLLNLFLPLEHFIICCYNNCVCFDCSICY